MPQEPPAEAPSARHWRPLPCDFAGLHMVELLTLYKVARVLVDLRIAAPMFSQWASSPPVAGSCAYSWRSLLFRLAGHEVGAKGAIVSGCLPTQIVDKEAGPLDQRATQPADERKSALLCKFCYHLCLWRGFLVGIFLWQLDQDQYIWIGSTCSIHPWPMGVSAGRRAIDMSHGVMVLYTAGVRVHWLCRDLNSQC
jgi:hypothetical protein